MNSAENLDKQFFRAKSWTAARKKHFQRARKTKKPTFRTLLATPYKTNGKAIILRLKNRKNVIFDGNSLNS